MKLRVTTLLALAFFIFTTNIHAQVAYPRFQKHTVLEGETAQAVADNFHVALQDFCLLNDFPENVKLKPGQVVLVKQLQDGENEVVEAAPAKKLTPVKSEPAKKEEVKEEKQITEEAPLKKTEPTKTVTEEKSEPTPTKTVAEKKTKPAPVKSTPVVAEKPKPAPALVAVKKQAAEEPFVVPPPSTKAVEVGPHGVKYNVSHTGYHIVAKNQTFFRIALIYGMSVDELKALNGLDNTTVEIGQQLKVRK